MDFSEEWKSLWPICSVFAPPLLIPNEEEPSSKRRRTENPIGPLVFKPCEESITVLHSSPLLSCRLPPPIPEFSVPKTLQIATTTLCSTSTSIASEFGPQISDSIHDFNAIQLLRCPNIGEEDNNSNNNSIIAIFPTGENYDQVGFSILCLDGDQVISREFKDGKYFMVNDNKLNCRISKLLVNPVTDFDCSCSTYGSSSYVTFGYVLACTLYSVYWYVVKMVKGIESVVLDYFGTADRNLFRGCTVSHACWSQHLSEECVVMLDTGELFLFDMGSMAKSRNLFGSYTLQGKKLRVLWDKLDIDGKWFSCEFSWHPRILIVAHSSAVFSVDLRSQSCKICILLKIESVSSGKTDKFVALSRVGSNAFCYTAASQRLLLLCDVRKPLMPLLQWVHGLNNPTYVTIFRLSDLRPNAKDDNCTWASKSGHCILLGSFWDSEFALFCYGPGKYNGQVLSEISKLSKSVYAWGQPSGFSLSGRDCYCENCLVREDFSKDVLPDWIDWRQKKEIVLGFGILNRELSMQLDDSDNFVGFLLVRLMSTGKLEAQKYTAAWEYGKRLEVAHGGRSLYFEENFLYDMGNEELDDSRRPYYVDLDFINEYLHGNLSMILDRKRIENQMNAEEIPPEFNQQICQNLKACAITGPRSSKTISDVFKSINFPTSIHDIALESISASLPNNLLALAFSAFSRFPEDPLKHKKGSSESFDILDKLNNLPFPLHKYPCAGEASEKVHSSSSYGPLLPPPILVALHNQQMIERDIVPVDAELRLLSDKVMEVAHEIGLSHSGEPNDGHAVSLAEDTEHASDLVEKLKPLCLHEPVALIDSSISGVESDRVAPGSDSRFKTFIYRKHQEPASNATPEMKGKELFDEGCPVELKFDDSDIDLGPNELETFKLLKKMDLKFQNGFQLYQDYLIGANIPKQDS